MTLALLFGRPGPMIECVELFRWMPLTRKFEEWFFLVVGKAPRPLPLGMLGIVGVPTVIPYDVLGRVGF